MKDINTAIKEARLPFLAFGVVGSFSIAGNYETSRLYVEENSRQGIEKIRDTSAALKVVANRYSSVEEANTMDPSLKGVQAPSNTTGNTGFDLAQYQGPRGIALELGGAAGIGITLIAIFTLNQALLTTAATMAKAAIFAGIAWVLVTPDDESIKQAVTSWGRGATSAQQLSADLDTQLLPLASGWTKGDALASFNRYRKTFRDEIIQLQGACITNRDTLGSVRTSLFTLMWGLFGISLLALIAIIAAYIAEKCPPPISAVATVVKETIGAILASTTVGVVIVISTIIYTTTNGLVPLMHTTTFAKATQNSDTVGTDFKDIKIDWARPQLTTKES
jgi:hypothetical protein